MSSSSNTYADIILPLSVPQYYTYRVPEELQEAAQPGIRCTVVLGRRRLYTGIIRKLHADPPQGFQMSDIQSILDQIPYVSEMQMKFWEWVADYYMCTVGEVYRAALPSGLKLESESRVYPGKPDEGLTFTPTEDQILDVVENDPGISIQKLAAALKKNTIMPSLKSLMEKGAASLEEDLKASYKARLKDYVYLHEQYHEENKLHEMLNQLDKRAAKQVALVLKLLQLGNYQPQANPCIQPVSKKELLHESDVSPASLKGLVDKEIFRIQTEEVSRLSSARRPVRKPYALNENQTKAYLKIQHEFEEKEVCLLHGVTSSGKTEVYIHLIEHYIRQGKQVLYLLPEIALTSQIIQRLYSVFGDAVGVYHSKFSDEERVEVYQNLIGLRRENSPSYKIILGVRSSIFLPFNNLGLIIVDEEHENTYKQFDPAPRYNARDAAVVLASMHGARLLMGTATPSFESYLNALNGRYAHVELLQRFMDIQLPEIVLVNLREARKRKQMSTHFSKVLIDAIQQTLDNKEQIILFQNRRGFSPYVECTTCGWIPYCKHCDVSLTYHKHSNRLNCHYCGYSIPHPNQCGSCGSPNVQNRGFGTEKIEDDIAQLFPEAKVARMDLDTVRTRKAGERIIQKFQDRQVDILIGTQMVSKGLDFDHVRVVGILNADNMLNFPDFRSFERSFQLIAQVSGRAGRKGEQGRVIVQSADPQHIVLQHVLKNDYKGFFANQQQERGAFKYPPYYRLVKLTLRHKKLPIVSQASNFLADELRKSLGNRVVGPEFPLINRLFTYHQKCILVKIERDKHFSERRRRMQAAIDLLFTLDKFKGIQVVPDVDPYN